MTVRDPFEILASANPLSGLEESMPGDEVMLRSILTGTSSGRRRRRGRNFWIAGGTGLAAVGLAAFVVMHRESPKDPTQISCYSAAAALPTEQHSVPVAPDPVAACREVWASGGFGEGRDVPPLTACVNEGGIIAVIPGDTQVCDRLGLANWSGALTDDEQRLVAFTDEISTLFGLTCIEEGQAGERAREVLDKYGLQSWTVVDNDGYTSTRRCSAVGVDPTIDQVSVAGRRGTP